MEYVSAAVARVIGTSSSARLTALECWAHEIKRASRRLTSLLRPDDWNYIAAQLGAFQLSSEVEEPGRLLAEKAPELSETLSALTYIEAWSVMLSLAFLESYRDKIDTQKDHWWEPDYRGRFYIIGEEEL